MFTRRQTLHGAAAMGLLPKAGRASAAERRSAMTLWYRQPANAWVEALPVGNGRIGAMVFGGVDEERLQLNEDTLWAGSPYDPNSPEALAALPEVRRLIAGGRYAEAQALAQERMMARPIRQMSYQTVGDLLLDFAGDAYAEQYRRDLDLDAALAAVRFRRGGVTYVREVFASPTDQVVVVRLSADRPGAVSFRARFHSPLPGEVVADSDGLTLTGVNGSQPGIAAGLRFQARALVKPVGGVVTAEADAVSVRGADAVLILIAMATSYRRYDDVSGDPAALTRQALAQASRRSYADLLRRHTAAHRRLFRRVTIDLGTTAAAQLPTDERVRRSESLDDPALAALYYQYGRYLLISCSRPETQPANLQGLWNDKLNAPWGSKYTININTEMNYWPAEPTDLGECAAPLTAMVKDLAVTGARTARVNYGAGGWVAHHNTDLWRATAPIDGARYGMWPTGGAWLCMHLWDRWDYGRDRAYLAEIYPVLKGAAQFFLDTLVEAPQRGWLVTSPSLSPENLHPHGAAVCAGPAMDQQILRDLFDRCIAAGEILGVDPEFRRRLAETRARLAPDQIGKAGQLQEWLEDWDLEAPEPNHRHVSHLYALFPSGQIDVHKTPELAAAARKSLDMRGDLSTGWAIGWRLNLWARLGDGERAHRVLKLLLGPERTYPNLFDAHPPFQIDGNFGGTSGITEMLLQSVDDEIRLLPARPAAWPKGSIHGLKARGGFGVDLNWEAGRLAEAVIRGGPARHCIVRYGEQTLRLSLGAGRRARLRLVRGDLTQG